MMDANASWKHLLLHAKFLNLYFFFSMNKRVSILPRTIHPSTKSFRPLQQRCVKRPLQGKVQTYQDCYTFCSLPVRQITKRGKTSSLVIHTAFITRQWFLSFLNLHKIKIMLTRVGLYCKFCSFRVTYCPANCVRLQCIVIVTIPWWPDDTPQLLY